MLPFLTGAINTTGMCIRNYICMYKINLFCMYFAAPVCFNTTHCGGTSIGNNSLSYGQCCFELSGVSFAAPGQCLLCPKSGTHMHVHTCVLLTIVELIIELALVVA